LHTASQKKLRSGPKIHRAFSDGAAGLVPAIHIFVAACR
jgi:hypothetical protein